MQEFEINNYITLKLEGVKTNIYIKGKKFRQCKHVSLNFPIEKISEYCYLESIDVITERLNDLLERKQVNGFIVSPEEEFWVHCSNMQAWAENNYDNDLLHSDIAWALLIELENAGDPLAKKACERERETSYSRLYDRLIYYRKEYLNFLSEDDITTVQQNLMLNFFESLSYKDIIFQKDKTDSMLHFFTNKFPLESTNIIMKEIQNYNINVIHVIVENSEFIDWKLLLEDLKISFFEVIFKSITSLKETRKNLIEEVNSIQFLTDHNKIYLLGRIETDESYYDYFIMRKFEKLFKLVPDSMKKKVIESFQNNNSEAIELIIKTGLIGYFRTEEITSIPSNVQSRMIINFLRYFDYKNNEFIIGKEPESGRYAFGGLYERLRYMMFLLKLFYNNNDKSRKILIKEINRSIPNGSYLMIKELLRAINNEEFKIHQNLICMINYSNQAIFEKILFLSMHIERQSEDLEDFHDYLKEALYDLGTQNIKSTKKKIIQKIKQGKYEDFVAIIRLGWLEHFKSKDFQALLNDNRLNFIELLINYLNVSLNHKDYVILTDRINFCMGLIYRIFKMDNKKYFHEIMNGISLNIGSFMDTIYTLISNEILPEFINKNVVEYGTEILKTLNPKYFPLNS